ncbi:hypothetical protein [Clostridium phage cpp]|uniref:Uncharacterized protein n=1 Tax=Clostridium phage cpp TaxID=3042444 RepID=A0AAF0K687_9CAUD|nr:hypothetical protein [Clostridium phage cpp]
MGGIQVYCYNRRSINMPCRCNCLYGNLCDLCTKKYYTLLGNLSNKQIENLKSGLYKND